CVALECLGLVARSFEVNHQRNGGSDQEGRCWWQQARQQADQDSECQHNVDDGNRTAFAEVVGAFFLLFFLSLLEIRCQGCHIDFATALEFTGYMQLCDATLFRPADRKSTRLNSSHVSI